MAHDQEKVEGFLEGVVKNPTLRMFLLVAIAALCAYLGYNHYTADESPVTDSEVVVEGDAGVTELPDAASTEALETDLTEADAGTVAETDAVETDATESVVPEN